MNVIEIRAPRLTLQTLDLTHLDSAMAYSADPELTRYMMFLPVDSREELRRSIVDSLAELEKPRPGYYRFAALLDGAHIGGAGLYLDAAPDLGELGWILLPRYQGHGYAAEAARALMGWARDRLGVRRFTAHCDAENLASQAVIRRLGMTLADDTGTRQNRGSDEVRREYRYEVTV